MYCSDLIILIEQDKQLAYIRSSPKYACLLSLSRLHLRHSFTILNFYDIHFYDIQCMALNNQYKKYTYTTTICQYICPICGLTIFRKSRHLFTCDNNSLHILMILHIRYWHSQAIAVRVRQNR